MYKFWGFVFIVGDNNGWYDQWIENRGYQIKPTEWKVLSN